METIKNMEEQKWNGKLVRSQYKTQFKKIFAFTQRNLRN